MNILVIGKEFYAHILCTHTVLCTCTDPHDLLGGEMHRRYGLARVCRRHLGARGSEASQRTAAEDAAMVVIDELSLSCLDGATSVG